MKLWDWVLAVYAGASATLIELQDAHDQQVDLLLWAGWAAAEGRPVGADQLAVGAALARTWETAALGPLRAGRRGLKALGADVLKKQAQDVELAAERALLEALEALAPAAIGTGPAIADALEAAGRAWGGAPPKALLDQLARAFQAG